MKEFNRRSVLAGLASFSVSGCVTEGTRSSPGFSSEAPKPITGVSSAVPDERLPAVDEQMALLDSRNDCSEARTGQLRLWDEAWI